MVTPPLAFGQAAWAGVLDKGAPVHYTGGMMEKLALKILGLLDDVRYTTRDLDYLAWQLVYQAPKPMQKRLVILADAILFHHNDIKEQANDDQYTLF